jgi:DNA modification methylase
MDKGVMRMELDHFYCGDAIKIMRRNIPDKSINLICADPPYNLGKDYGNTIDNLDYIFIYPARHFVIAEDKKKRAIDSIKQELEMRSKESLPEPNSVC